MAAETNYNFYFGMDCNGDYPGSHVKRLRVDDTAIIGGDTTIGGNLSVNGDIKCASFTEEKILTGDGTEEYPSHSFTAATGTGMYRTTDTKDVAFAKSGTKRLRVGDTSEFYSAVTVPTLRVNGTSSFGGTIDCTTDITSAGTMRCNNIWPSSSEAVFLTTTDPTALVASQTSDIVIAPALQEAVKFGTSAATFSVPVVATYGISGSSAAFSSSSLGTATASSLAVTNCTASDIYTTTFGASVMVATNCILTSVGCTSLGATNLIGTNSTLGAATCSSLSSTNQILTTFVSTAAVTISTNSFTLYNGWATTPSISRGSPAVTVSGSTFTINKTGYYDVGFQIMWAASATGQRSACMRINGAPTNFAYDMRNAVTGGFVTSNMGSMRRYLSANDTIDVEVWQNTGGSLNIQNNGNQIIGMSFMQQC